VVPAALARLSLSWCLWGFGECIARSVAATAAALSTAKVKAQTKPLTHYPSIDVHTNRNADRVHPAAQNGGGHSGAAGGRGDGL